MQQTEILTIIILATLIVVVFVVGIIWLIVHLRNRKIQYQAEKKAMQLIHLNNLKETALQMQLLTMQDIGREIHDGIGQRLTLASIYSKQLISKNLNEESNHKIEEISQIINESLEQLRSLSKELTNEQEHHIDLVKMIQVEAEKVKTLGICKIIMTNDQELYMDNKKAMFIVRIVQEFMQNSLKHADCKTIIISVINILDTVQLTIDEDGKGFDTSLASNGIGLQNMNKRAEMIGATLSISSVIQKGTSLQLQLPL